MVASDGQSCQTPSPTHKKSLQSKNSDLRDIGVFLDPVKASFFLFGGAVSLFSSVFTVLFVHQAARVKSDLTVEELTDRVGITERYLYRIENEGKVPTFEVLKKIVRELAIDGNLIFYPEKQVKDSEVEDLVRMLYSCDDRSLKIIRATVKAALESQTEKE